MHGWCTCLWYRLIIGWGIGWCMVKIYWYKFTLVYLIVIVWKWFHNSTSTSGRLNGARTAGCSHLLVVARELGSWSFPHVVAWENRGLEPPSSLSLRIGIWCFLECNSLTYNKIIPWFSPHLVSTQLLVYYVFLDVSLIFYYALMADNVYDEIMYWMNNW